MKRWRLWRRGKLVWSEPAQPPWLKTNPLGVPDEGLQPGDLTIAMEAEEFLLAPEPEDEGY